MGSISDTAALTQSGLNLIPQAISIFDEALRLVVCNRSFAVMFDLPEGLTRPGATFEGVIRHLVERGEYGSTDDPEAAIRVRVDQASRFEPHYFERTRANGRIISVEGAPLAQGGWIAVYTDITETRRQQAMLRARSEELSDQVLDHAERLAAANRALAATNARLEEAQRVLIAAEARTRQVTGMVPAHIAHVDAEGRYTFSNRQLGAVFAGAPREIVGMTAEKALGPETWAVIAPHVDRAQSGAAQVAEITHEASGRRIRVALTPDGDGGAYVLSTDVTAEVQAREALTHAARRTLGAQLTSGLAHDFGNLLTVILALQERLAAAGLPGEAAEAVAATQAAARRGTALLARINAITAPGGLALRPVDPQAVLDEVATLARAALDGRAHLQVRAEALPERVLLDPGPLTDAVLNLVLNARDAMAGTGGTIRLSARTAGAWLEIAVEDEGPGFSPEALERAVEPFFTTKGARGSGLGLSMVYDHVKLAGGTMRIENRAEGGARIRLRLPLRAVSPRMVLLVDDEDAIRAHVRDALTAQGHAVIEAGSVGEARGLLDLPGLDLVLSDIQLGDGLGSALLDAAPVPGLLMTSLPEGHPLRVGAPCPVLGKPVDPSQLAAKIAEATA